MIALWFWQDDCDLVAFSDGVGGVIVLRWLSNGALVRKRELKRGDHVLFDRAGNLIAIHRSRHALLNFAERRQAMLDEAAYQPRGYQELPRIPYIEGLIREKTI